MRRIAGTYTSPPNPSLPSIASNRPYIQQIADHLAETFATNSADSNHTEEFLKIKNSTNLTTEHLSYNLDSINNPCSLKELKQAIFLSKNTSPELDDIPNMIIKMLPDNCTIYLLQLYNHIWSNQIFPDQWRETIVIPIAKPNKDHTKASNFRLISLSPISLTCNLSKIIEKMICKKLRWKLEN